MIDDRFSFDDDEMDGVIPDVADAAAPDGDIVGGKADVPGDWDPALLKELRQATGRVAHEESEFVASAASVVSAAPAGPVPLPQAAAPTTYYAPPAVPQTAPLEGWAPVSAIHRAPVAAPPAAPPPAQAAAPAPVYYQPPPGPPPVATSTPPRHAAAPPAPAPAAAAKPAPAKPAARPSSPPQTQPATPTALHANGAPPPQVSSERRVQLFEAYQSLDNVVVDLEAKLAVATSQRAAAIEAIATECGSGPFRWKGQELLVARTKSGKYGIRRRQSVSVVEINK